MLLAISSSYVEAEYWRLEQRRTEQGSDFPCICSRRAKSTVMAR